jgi:DNA polymerase IIIc chi subunit
MAQAEASFTKAAAEAPAGSERAQWAAFNLALSAALSGDTDAARDRWRFYRDRGYPIHTHEAGTPRPA